MFPNGHNIKWIQLQSKHGLCPKLGALGKYFQFISMKKSIANWNYLFVGMEKDLSNNPHQLPVKVILIQRISFSKKKKERKFSKKALGLGALGSYFLGCFQKKKINQNFQFHEKIQDFQIFQKKKSSKFSIPWKNSRFLNFSKKKINQNFQFHEKIQDFQIFQKKKEGNFQKGPWD